MKKVTIAGTVIILAMMVGCRRTPRVDAPISTIKHENWVAEERKPGIFYVFARSQADVDIAMKEICTATYICFGPDFQAEMVLVERRAKK